METKYVKAIKAGLICAFIIVIIRLATNVAFYWALTKPSLRQWASNQSISPQYPPSVSNLPPEALVAGVAICGGALLIYAIYVVAGILSAWYAAPFAKGVKDMLILGAIAGAITQAVSAPFQLVMVVLLNLATPGNEEWFTNIGSWLFRSIITDYTVSLIPPIVLAAVASLIAGAIIRAYGRPKVPT